VEEVDVDETELEEVDVDDDDDGLEVPANVNFSSCFSIKILIGLTS
jgi:hypothetical protein